ncbi:aminotransferase-like domain-containing protein [Commensalibacter communis]|nr:PLP-dependent aminotransferase family protein [Commensalibacter communis]
MSKKTFKWKKIYSHLVKRRNSIHIEDGRQERLPSIHDMIMKFGCSKTTVLRAIEQLERDGLVYSKQRIGYFFTLKNNQCIILRKPNISTSRSDQINELLYYNPKNGMYNYSNAVLDKSLAPHSYIQKCLRAIITGSSSFEEEFIPSPGLPSLRNRLSFLMVNRGIHCHADDILITSGDTQSLGTILKNVINQNSKILLVVPCYYGIIQFIESNKLPAVTIPLSDTGDEIDILNLEKILKTENIGLFYINPTIHNPTGRTLTTHTRNSIYKLMKTYQIPILEDDIFYDLMVGPDRPKPFKSIDDDNIVIYFSSFSKTLSPGFRVGWCLPGKFRKEIFGAELLNNSTVSSITQKILDEYLKRGYYTPHIVYLQSVFKKNNQFMKDLIAMRSENILSYTPPTAGFIHWIKLNKEFNMETYRKYCLSNKTFVPSGNIFFLDKTNTNFVRLCTGLKMNKKDITNLTFLINSLKNHLS